MQNVIYTAQITVGILLLSVILIQAKGNGLGRVWGGWNMSFSRRGLEQFIFRSTFVLAFLFILLAIVGFLS
jgi:protein translocase SecG subunit